MNQQKVVFIIPGYKHHPKNKAYKEIAKLLKKEGFRPVPVNIPWNQTTISENTEFFLQKFKKLNSRKKYILGFSFGAMIAFLASTKVKVTGLVLCSLSPYFKEDLIKVNGRKFSSLKKQQYQDFAKLHCKTLAKKTKAKQVLMLYGTKESRLLKKRVSKAFNQIASVQKYLIPVEKTEHKIGDRRYLNKIHEATKVLN